MEPAEGLGGSLPHVELAAFDIDLDKVDRWKRLHFGFGIEAGQGDLEFTYTRLPVPRSCSLRTQRSLREVISWRIYHHFLASLPRISNGRLEDRDIGDPRSPRNRFPES